MSEQGTPQSKIKFTHPERLYWPGDGVTKEGLADYYTQVWRYMAPLSSTGLWRCCVVLKGSMVSVSSRNTPGAV